MVDEKEKKKRMCEAQPRLCADVSMFTVQAETS